MKIDQQDPPRTFEVGFPEHRIELKDCAHIHLEPDEQVTFKTPQHGEYDLTRKDWGFYATPSLNGRLLRYGLHATLVKNRAGQYFILLVEDGHEDAFNAYIAQEKLQIVTWLDSDDTLQAVEQTLATKE